MHTVEDEYDDDHDNDEYRKETAINCVALQRRYKGVETRLHLGINNLLSPPSIIYLSICRNLYLCLYLKYVTSTRHLPSIIYLLIILGRQYAAICFFASIYVFNCSVFALYVVLFDIYWPPLCKWWYIKMQSMGRKYLVNIEDYFWHE